MPPGRIPLLFSEFKRRRVFRVAGLYAVAAWAAIQVAATVFPILELPAWTVKLVVVLVSLGFPFALGLAWAFDLQHDRPPPPEDQGPASVAAPVGLRRERNLHIPWLRPALAALLVVLVCGGGWAIWRRRGSGAAAHATSPAVVAVLPFDVRAPNAEDYWRDGMVSLLAVRLDGAAGLRSVDPQALLRSATTGGASRPEQARRVASRLGAGLFVLGSVVGGSTRIQVAASLYETGGRGHPLATASAEGPADSVFALVDRIAIQLLATRAERDAGAAETAGLTTSSLPALRAYLDGERAFRQGRVGTAVEAYTRAVTIDSTFALAYSRLSNAGNWHDDDSVAVWASAAAVRHSGRLPPHYRELLAADAAFLRGSPDIEDRLRQILSRYPQDAEVWYRLGEVLYHRNHVRGRSMTEAREPFERALALDPANEMYLGHLRHVACMQGRLHELSRLPTPPSPDSLDPVVRGPLGDGTLAALAGSPGERNAALARLASVHFSGFFELVEVAVNCGPTDLLPALFALADRRPEDADDWWLRQQLERTRARWNAAATAIARRSDPMTDPYLRQASLLDPLRAPGPDAVRRERAALLAMNPGRRPAVPSPAPDSLDHVSVRRLYWLGMLAAQFGDPGEALEYADRLEHFPSTSSLARAETPLLVALVRAHALARTGRQQEALGVLDEFDARGLIRGGMIPGALVENNTRGRWIRAELLRAMGRDREALPWYVTVAEDLDAHPYQAPVQLRLAQVRERLNQPRDAARHYRRFLALWRDADPEVQPLVRDAERRLAALER